MSNADIARSYLDSFASGDPALVAGHVTDDFENIQVGLLGTGCSGANAYAERLVGFLGAFTNLKYEIEELIVDGDKVSASYRMTFTDNNRPMEIEGRHGHDNQGWPDCCPKRLLGRPVPHQAGRPDFVVSCESNPLKTHACR
jgi:predicted ester cyclase